MVLLMPAVDKCSQHALQLLHSCYLLSQRLRSDYFEIRFSVLAQQKNPLLDLAMNLFPEVNVFRH